MGAKKAVSRPSVKRGDDGKIISLKPKPGPTSGLPEFVGKTQDPKALPSKPVKARKKTRSGKSLKTPEGKVAVPLVTRGDSGKIRATTAEEKKAAATTVLPTAGPKPEKKPEGRMSMGATPIKKGFAVAYPIVEKAVHAATHHLGNMRGTYGTDEFHAHHEAFNAIHANIGQMSPELHTSLGQAKHEIMHPSDKTDGNLALIHKAINARLAIGRAVHTDNLKRAAEGNPK